MGTDAVDKYSINSKILPLVTCKGAYPTPKPRCPRPMMTPVKGELKNALQKWRALFTFLRCSKLAVGSELIPINQQAAFVTIGAQAAGDHLDRHTDFNLILVDVGELGSD